MRSRFGGRAQLSLEYLLLLAAFFSCLLLFLPLLQKSYAAALFGIDARNASFFSESLAQASRELSVLGEGTAVSIGINPLNPWQISVQGNRLLVSVSSGVLGKTKEFSAELSMPAASFSKEFSEKAALKVSKTSGLLVIDG